MLKPMTEAERAHREATRPRPYDLGNDAERDMNGDRDDDLEAAIRAVITRIKRAVAAGRGVRLSAEEVHLLAGVGPLADGDDGKDV